MAHRINVISLSLALLFAAAPVRADRGRRVTGGPVLGLNIAGAGGDTSIDLFGAPLAPELEARERLAIGAFASLLVSPQLALRAELLYSMKGATSDGSDPSDPSAFYELRYSRTYLAIPLLASYRIDYDGEFTPRLFAGPELDVRLSSDVSASAGATDPMGTPLVVELDEDLADASAAVDVAVVVGAGLGMPLGSGALVLDVRYVQGVTRAVDAHEVTPTQGVILRGDAQRDHVFALVASYEL